MDKLMRQLLNAQAIGSEGEEAATEFLRSQGITVMFRNYKTKFGELDIVGMDGDTLVFYEVKTTASQRGWASPFEVVSLAQRRRIKTSARQFMAAHTGGESSCRFDVLVVFLRHDGSHDVQSVSPAFY